MKDTNIRIFKTDSKASVYQFRDSGLVQEVVNNSVWAEALPSRPANYNSIVSKITGYSFSYIRGTRDTIKEEGVEIPQPV